jgi:hypothetical protein
MEKLKKGWINGIRISWRLFLLFFMVNVTYQFGAFGATLLSELIGVESLKEWFLGIFGILCIIFFPVIVSYMADNVGLKAEVYDFSFSKRMKKRRVNQSEQDNPITRP